jgi:hypothetical protein
MTKQFVLAKESKDSDINHFFGGVLNAVFDMFIDKFFPEHKKYHLTTHDTENIRKTMEDIKEHILQCRKLVKGEWLYREQ